MLQLHNFHSSSSSFRVRIALNLKGLPYEYVPVELAVRDGAQHTAQYRAFNPQGNVPVLVDGAIRIAQTLAILEYLDATHPEPRLFPKEPAAAARVRSVALHIACEMQPISSMRVERYLADELQLDTAGVKKWRQHWTALGLDVLEQMLAGSPATGRFCQGDAPTAADCFLAPQVMNALKVELDMNRWPTVKRVYEACMAHPAFERALPKHQPDFVAPKL